jgi:hypothetical protein
MLRRRERVHTMAQTGLLVVLVVVVHLMCLMRACSGSEDRVDGALWVELLSPQNGSVVYYADETTKIEYRTSHLPPSAQVRLSINGKEAMLNAATLMTVNVPGLVIGQHEVAVTIVDAGGGELLGERVLFEVRAGFSWVSRHVVLAEPALAASCSAARVCSFLIDARGDGSSPASGHFFRVRLQGPAIVMASVHELNSTRGVYRAEYRAVDAGQYSVSVVLLHASDTGLADPGQGIPRQFLNQHIHSSPFVVHVSGGSPRAPSSSLACPSHSPSCAHMRASDPGTGEDGGVDVEGGLGGGAKLLGIADGRADLPFPLCPGMRRYARHGRHGVTSPPWATGRWVHRDLCAWYAGGCEGVGSERIDQEDDQQFADDPWVWVPHGDERRAPSLECVRACVPACLHAMLMLLSCTCSCWCWLCCWDAPRRCGKSGVLRLRPCV